LPIFIGEGAPIGEKQLRLPSEPPKIHRSRGPPQAGLWGDEESQEVGAGDAAAVDDLADQDQSVDW
jgi:hypothetical protein